MDRRRFLEALGWSALAVPFAGEAFGKAPATALGAPAVRPYDIKPGLAKLPAWDGGGSSESKRWMLMFRGNLAHTFYGAGTLPASPRLLWKFKMADFSTLKHGAPVTWKGTGWTGQSIRYGDYVWAGSTGGHMHCFEAETGKLVWYVAAQRMIKGSPCLWNNKLYFVSVDNHLRCVDAASGKLLWRWVSSNDIDSSPCVYDAHLYVGGEDGAVKCFDADTGKLKWRANFGVGCCEKPGSGGIESSLAIDGGRGFFGHLDGHVRGIDIRDGKLLWSAKVGGDTDSSPCVTGDRLFIGTESNEDSFFCLSTETGKKLWSKRIPTGVWSTAAAADGKVWVGGNDGKLYCFSAADGSPLWTHNLGISTWNSPVLVDGKILIGAYDRWYRMIDASSGKQLWRFDVGDRCHSAAAVLDGKIWVGSASGYYYCFG